MTGVIPEGGPHMRTQVRRLVFVLAAAALSLLPTATQVVEAGWKGRG